MSYTYHHGGDTYETPDVLDFSININPLGMPEEAKEAAVKSLETVGRYPDWKCRDLTEALREYASERNIFLKSGQIVWGNGAAELIYALCERIMLDRHQLRAWIAAPTFSAYEEAVLAVGGTLAKRIEESDLIFLCNPNNPTGELRDEKTLEQYAKICEENGAWLCVDESFLPFADPFDCKSVVRLNHSRVVMLRSLTKIYAMPGLRLGFLAGPEKMAEGVRQLLQPWNISIPAQAAGKAALLDREFLEKTYRYIKKERDFLLEELESLPVKVIAGSEANFLLLEAGEDFADQLLKQGILVRRCEDIRGLTNRHFRIAVRSHEENLKLIAAIRAGSRKA